VRRVFRITIVAEVTGVIAPEAEVRAAVAKIKGLKAMTVRAQHILQPHEEEAIMRQHAEADHAAARDWNDAKQGCGCGVCREYRQLGFQVSAKEGK